MQKEKSFFILFMGLLVGFPALTTDIYLPSFPALTRFFDTSISSIQMSLMATMIGIALGQLIVGPLSDKYGRKAPLQISIIVFMITTLFCIYSKNVYLFIILRLAQGFSCSGGMVLSRAMLTDSFSGQELTKSLSANTAVLSITPALAPVLGGLILVFAPWQGVFVGLFCISALFLAFTFSMHETLLPQSRSKKSTNIKSFTETIANKTYLLYVLIFAFTMSLMFAYISSSPFIFQEHYKLSPLLYGIFFGINAFATTIGAIITSQFKDLQKMIRIGAVGLFSMSIFTAIVLVFGNSYILCETSIFIMFVFIGLLNSSSTAIAMGSSRQNAGTASAILGAMSFLFGGIISPLVGLGNILIATSIAIVICSSVVFILVFYQNLSLRISALQLIYIRISKKL